MRQRKILIIKNNSVFMSGLYAILAGQFKTQVQMGIKAQLAGLAELYEIEDNLGAYLYGLNQK